MSLMDLFAEAKDDSNRVISRCIGVPLPCAVRFLAMGFIRFPVGEPNPLPGSIGVGSRSASPAVSTTARNYAVLLGSPECRETRALPGRNEPNWIRSEYNIPVVQADPDDIYY